MANPDPVSEPADPNLPLLKSPLVENHHAVSVHVDKEHPSGPEFGEFGYRDASDTGLEFQRHNEATAVEVRRALPRVGPVVRSSHIGTNFFNSSTLQVFYDLFFAANLCVFAEVQDITNADQLSNFVVYFR